MAGVPLDRIAVRNPRRASRAGPREPRGTDPARDRAPSASREPGRRARGFRARSRGRRRDLLEVGIAALKASQPRVLQLLVAPQRRQRGAPVSARPANGRRRTRSRTACRRRRTRRRARRRDASTLDWTSSGSLCRFSRRNGKVSSRCRWRRAGLRDARPAFAAFRARPAHRRSPRRGRVRREARAPPP